MHEYAGFDRAGTSYNSSYSCERVRASPNRGFNTSSPTSYCIILKRSALTLLPSTMHPETTVLSKVLYTARYFTVPLSDHCFNTKVILALVES